MALAKDRAPPCSFYGSYMLELGNPSSALYPFEEDHSQKQLSLQGEDDIGNTHQVQTLVSHSPPLSTSSSATSSNGFTFHGGGSSYPQPEEAPSLINFNKVSTATAIATTTNYGGSHLMHTNGSLLSFQPQNCYSFGQPNDYPLWEGSIPRQNVAAGGDFRVFEEANCLPTSGGSGGGVGAYHDAAGEWLFGEGAAVALDCAQESPTLQQTSLSKKRSLMEEENVQILKKQCNITRKQQPNKPKPSSATKDPQSIAAKNRRERISERLKILQDLVPNGSKVDLVTMLEKAISYVKFLQLQVKVLASDEFWPAGGGKLPDVTQVREAIDAILSSQRDKSSSTSH